MRIARKPISIRQAILFEAYSNRARLRAKAHATLCAHQTFACHKPAMAKTVRLDKNAGLMVDVEALGDSGAENIGLFRTELQFMVSARLPRRSEQEEVLSRRFG